MTARRKRRLLYGVALQTRHLADAPLAEAAAREANLLVPEYEAQWRIIHPEPQRYDFRAIDRLEAFAREHRTQFRARQADDRLLLSYNEYGIQHGDANSDRKRAAVLRLLEGLRRRDVPVDALGVQSHLSAGLNFDEQKFRRFIGEVAGMGLKVFISELDVRDRELPGDADPRDRAVADLTRRFLDTALDERAVKVVVTWDVSDRHSWLNDVANSRRSDGQPVRGLPLDDQMARKPMWCAMAAAFDAALPGRAPRRTSPRIEIAPYLSVTS